jgi:4a-hydroxytetrahydrobiopterin dehydratase
MQKLDDTQIRDRLSQLSGWTQKGDKIEKSLSFADFAEAMDFVNDVADLAEEAEHHPDFAIHYNEVTLTLWTHDAGGLTRRDFDLAEKIDALRD